MINSCPVGCSYPRMESIYHLEQAYTYMREQTDVRFVKNVRNETGSTLYFESKNYKEIWLEYSFIDEEDPAKDTVVFKGNLCVDKRDVTIIYDFIEQFWMNRLYEDIIFPFINWLEDHKEEK